MSKISDTYEDIKEKKEKSKTLYMSETGITEKSGERSPHKFIGFGHAADDLCRPPRRASRIVKSDKGLKGMQDCLAVTDHHGLSVIKGEVCSSQAATTNPPRRSRRKPNPNTLAAVARSPKKVLCQQHSGQRLGHHLGHHLLYHFLYLLLYLLRSSHLSPQ
ncbi:uncharacterized protein P174DRAFT_126604 [Aspergillus novofumigatus IBT 16806]|uniref:Uncharacterized protein n=1 Tax=Aspergillus novofumigatus (strain IBT 16806) TaxID=1392255 RepID=A0A2I1CC00_ASPN1|nr:uncharacterized protein P174DRAFT_126604 [Aspergillus novofumigatus IBT 16806]PKX95134.1 hypothetical protein P174DRAFT_126604 [Aspergillus novofumigatus IBT 16806]